MGFVWSNQAQAKICLLCYRLGSRDVHNEISKQVGGSVLFFLSNHSQKLVNGCLGVEAFRASHCAHADVLALLQLEALRQFFQSFLRILVSGVDDPAVGLHEDGGAEILVGMPPVRGTRGGAASAEHALVEAVQFLPVFNTLIILLILSKTCLTPAFLTSLRLR